MKRKRTTRRLFWLVAVGLLLGLAGFGYVHFYFTRPVGSGPAGPAVPPAPFVSTWSDRPVLVLGIGDSVTAGLGAKNPSHSYFNRMIANPTDEFDDMRDKCLNRVLPNLTSLNVAVSGSTSLQHVHYIDERVEAQPADVFGLVFMTSGGNDIIHNYGRMPPKEGGMYGATLAQAQPWIANFEQRLNGMLERITACFPGGCEIYLADIYDPTDGVGDAPSVFLPHWPDGLAIHSAYNEVSVHDREVALAGRLGSRSSVA